MIRAVAYDESGTATYDDPVAAMAADGTTWIRAADPTDEEVQALRAACDLHPLAVEDVRNNVRPKVEEFDAHLFVLLKQARLTRGESTFEEEIDDRPVGLFLGREWIATVAPSETPAVDRAWDAVAAGDSRILDRGPDFTAYRIADGLVDEYFDLLDEIETRIERIEEAVIEEPGQDTLVEINAARRELLSLRKLLWPSREAVGVLARGDPDPIRESTEKYYRDVYDHLVQLVDLVETYRDLAGGARDIYLNVLSMSTNEVMKTLTVVAAVLLPLTFVAGVFGMNFESMPELGWPLAYPATVLGLAGVAGVLTWHFRRIGWL